MRPSTTLIPVAPIIAAIEARGGYEALFPREHEEETGAVIRSITHGDEMRLRMRVKRALAKGGIDIYLADDICVTNLGVHPMMVYGMEWFDFHVDAPVEAATVTELRSFGIPRTLDVAA